MAKVEIYTKITCGFCYRALALLKQKKVTYKQIRIDFNGKRRQEMIDRTGGHTVPQIIINDKPIGGCEEMYELEEQGKLDKLLQCNESASS